VRVLCCAALRSVEAGPVPDAAVCSAQTSTTQRAAPTQIHPPTLQPTTTRALPDDIKVLGWSDVDGRFDAR